ncbi:hypothetical protein LUW77_09295 [Streptomyces radiopugnans]|nr:hypothetical protein LUW77_09295 [Streptomyces radiopugnans]
MAAQPGGQRLAVVRADDVQRQAALGQPGAEPARPAVRGVLHRQEAWSPAHSPLLPASNRA